MGTSSPTDLIDAIEDVLQVTLDLARALDDADGIGMGEGVEDLSLTLESSREPLAIRSP